MADPLPPRRGDRDRDPQGRPRSARPRDALGRPLPREAAGTDPTDRQIALPPRAALAEAQRLLEMGRTFAAHEVLEAVWKSDGCADAPLWRGLAQLAVGATHALRGNQVGARALLDRAADTLAPYAGTSPYGVAVDALRAWAATSDGTTDPPHLTAPIMQKSTVRGPRKR